MIALLALALAAPSDRFPIAAPLDLPGTGVIRVRVPPALRTPADPPDGSDLQLEDVHGATVPVAVVRGDVPEERVSAVRSERDIHPLAVTPGDDGWVLRVRERPFDALRLLFPESPAVARVTIDERTPTGDVRVAEGMAWRLDDAVSPPLPLPPRTGTFLVRIDPIGKPPVGTLELVGVRLPLAGPDESLLLPVTSVAAQENGWVRYDVALPSPMPITWVEVRPTEALFDRRAAAGPPPTPYAPDALPSDHDPWNASRIQRVQLGGTHLDAVRLPVGEPVRDVLSVWVDSSGRAPLDIPEVVVGFPAEVLLVRDPGSGPFTLLAGAPPGTRVGSELQLAASELLRMEDGAATPAAPSPNPAWSPPEERSGLAAPSGELDPAGWSTRWPVTGGPGIARVRLTPEVLGIARADLGDLRLVDGQDRRIPYVLRADGIQHDLGDLPFVRTERKGTSVIEVTLPHESLLVGTVSLSTSAPLFDRQVRISRPDRGRLSVIRAFRWTGRDRPERLTLDVSRRLGRTLVVEIDNGDDPPLPIDAIRASWPGWELVAHLPDGETWLWAGNPREHAPSHDLALVGDLEDRAVSTATLGPADALQPRAVSLFDRVLLGIGVLVMALGLLALTLTLLRDVVAPRRADEPSGSDDEPPGPGDPDAAEPSAAPPPSATATPPAAPSAAGSAGSPPGTDP